MEATIQTPAMSLLAPGQSSAHIRVRHALECSAPRSCQLQRSFSPAIHHYRCKGSFSRGQSPLRSVSGQDEFSAPSASTSPNVPATPPIPPSNPLTQSSGAPATPNSDTFAKAWKPPPGEPPLWWVEKFEARRKAEARKKDEDPSFLTTQERIAARGEERKPGNPVLRFLAAVLQVIQLVVVLGLLLLLPAFMHDGGLGLDRPFTTFAAYLAFFGVGTLGRVVRYGKLAPRKADRQVASWRGRLAFAAFVVLVPLLHWYAMYRFVGLSLYTNAIPVLMTWYDLIGGVGMCLATALNFAASRELGAAYDRVTAPAALVTSGPYKFVQHPIYTSYMLLFFSYGMWLHSMTTALAMLLVCALYYRGRTALEAGVLEETFGGQYREYAARTKKFLPFLV